MLRFFQIVKHSGTVIQPAFVSRVSYNFATNWDDRDNTKPKRFTYNLKKKDGDQQEGKRFQNSESYQGKPKREKYQRDDSEHTSRRSDEDGEGQQFRRSQNNKKFGSTYDDRDRRSKFGGNFEKEGKPAYKKREFDNARSERYEGERDFKKKNRESFSRDRSDSRRNREYSPNYEGRSQERDNRNGDRDYKPYQQKERGERTKFDKFSRDQDRGYSRDRNRRRESEGDFDERGPSRKTYGKPDKRAALGRRFSDYNEEEFIDEERPIKSRAKQTKGKEGFVRKVKFDDEEDRAKSRQKKSQSHSIEFVNEQSESDGEIQEEPTPSRSKRSFKKNPAKEELEAYEEQKEIEEILATQKLELRQGGRGDAKQQKTDFYSEEEEDFENEDEMEGSLLSEATEAGKRPREAGRKRAQTKKINTQRDKSFNQEFSEEEDAEEQAQEHIRSQKKRTSKGFDEEDEAEHFSKKTRPEATSKATHFKPIETPLRWRMLKTFEEVTSLFLPKTQSISEFNKMLLELKNSRVSAGEFEGFCFKNYSFLLSKFLETLKKVPEGSAKVSELLSIFVSMSEVYSKLGRLESSKLITLKNHIIRHLVANVDSFTTQQALDYLTAASNFEERNLDFKKQLKLIVKAHYQTFDPHQSFQAIQKLAHLKIDQPEFYEVLIDKIFSVMKEFNLGEKQAFLASLSGVAFKPTKDFLLQMANSVSQDISADPSLVSSTNAIKLLLSFGTLESVFTHKFFYLDGLDNLYSTLLSIAVQSIDSFTPGDLLLLSQALERISHHDEELLNKIVTKTLSYEVFGLGEQEEDKEMTKIRTETNKLESELAAITNRDSKTYREKLIEVKRSRKKQGDLAIQIKRKYINLKVLSQIAHTAAFFNYKDPQFIEFLVKTVELSHKVFKLSGQPFIEFFDINDSMQLIWGLCVMGEPNQVEGAIANIIEIIIESQQSAYLNDVDLDQLYHAMMYLRESTKISPTDRKFVTEEFEKRTANAIKSISMVNIEISKLLSEIGAEHSVEQTVELIPVDFVLTQPDAKGRKIAIDFHGHSHYFRNTDRLKGGIALKEKILEGVECKYLQISIFDWMLLDEEGKKNYLRELLKTVNDS